jgi:hypothetical protein
MSSLAEGTAIPFGACEPSRRQQPDFKPAKASLQHARRAAAMIAGTGNSDGRTAGMISVPGALTEYVFD